MVRKLTAIILVLAIPAGASAGPLKQAMEKVGRDMARAQAQVDGRSRIRTWSSIGLIAGGGVMAALGGFEVIDDESGPDDGEDSDESDDGEDDDEGWGNTALIGAGIASAALGTVLLMRGRNGGPTLSIRPGRVVVRHSVRF